MIPHDPTASSWGGILLPTDCFEKLHCPLYIKSIHYVQIVPSTLNKCSKMQVSKRTER